MSVERSVRIDAEIDSIGQFDRLETFRGKLEVTRRGDGRVRLSQGAGFAGITLSYEELTEALEALATPTSGGDEQ